VLSIKTITGDRSGPQFTDACENTQNAQIALKLVHSRSKEKLIYWSIGLYIVFAIPAGCLFCFFTYWWLLAGFITTFGSQWMVLLAAPLFGVSLGTFALSLVCSAVPFGLAALTTFLAGGALLDNKYKRDERQLIKKTIETWAEQQSERLIDWDHRQLAHDIFNCYMSGLQSKKACFDFKGCDRLPPLDYSQFDQLSLEDYQGESFAALESAERLERLTLTACNNIAEVHLPRNVWALTLENYQGENVTFIEQAQQLNRLTLTACNNIAAVHLPKNLNQLTLERCTALPAVSGGHKDLSLRIHDSSLERSATIEASSLHLCTCTNVSKFLSKLDWSQIVEWGINDSVLLEPDDQTFPIEALEKLSARYNNRREIKNVETLWSWKDLSELRQVRATVVNRMRATTAALGSKLNYPFYVVDESSQANNEHTYDEEAESFFGQVAQGRNYVSVGPQLRIKMLSLAAFEAQQDRKSNEKMCRLVELVARKLIFSAGHAADAPDSQDSCSAAEQQMYCALDVLLNWITLPTDMERFHEMIRDAEEVTEDEAIGDAAAVSADAGCMQLVDPFFVPPARRRP